MSRNHKAQQKHLDFVGKIADQALTKVNLLTTEILKANKALINEIVFSALKDYDNAIEKRL